MWRGQRRGSRSNTRSRGRRLSPGSTARGDTCDSHSEFPGVPGALRQIPETARALRFLRERFLHQSTSHLNSRAGGLASTTSGHMRAIVLGGLRGGRQPPPSTSRAASAAGQSLSAKREQGVPGGAADYHKILNESPWVIPSLETKLLAEPAQPRRGPAIGAPLPSPRTTPSQRLRP